MNNDTAITAAGQDQAPARAAALGPMEGPCCSPAESAPCVACVVPDDVPYEPTEADLLWYRGLCRERDARLWEERIAADEEQARSALRRDEADARLAAAVYAAAKAPTFQQMLADLANAFHDHEDAGVSWVGGKLADLYDQSRWLEAKSGEQFDDRLQAHLDCIEAAHATR